LVSNLAQQESELIDQKDLREKYIGRLEVLDKVKTLFLIPKMEVMTTKMIAEYFEVGIETIKKCYQRNKEEIDSDGTKIVTPLDLKVHLVPISSSQCEKTFSLENGNLISIANRGIRCFSKRAVLRVAMLLRDSEVAREVRTQLLNTFEHSAVEHRTAEIDNETDLLISLAKSYVARDFDAFALANQNYIVYQNRNIEALSQENEKLAVDKSTLIKDNKALAGEILKWTELRSLNRAVRLLASRVYKPQGVIFKELYEEIRYKHGIALSRRGDPPLIQHIKEKEWPLVVQSFSAICDRYGCNPSMIIDKAKFTKNNRKLVTM